jgi:GAF domain-containing protein
MLSDSDKLMNQEQANELAATGAVLLAKTVTLLEHWATVINSYVAGSTQASFAEVTFTDGDDGLLVLRTRYPDWWPQWDEFRRDRLIEASEWLDPTDEPRISVWLADAHGKVLSFGGCTQNVGEALRATTFGAGEGVAGTAFSERAVRNEVNPSQLALFKHVADVPYLYKSILAIPICYGPLTLGVLCIDRMREDHFDPNIVRVMTALAMLLGIALAAAEARKLRDTS